jgi:hypothetical protein
MNADLPRLRQMEAADAEAYNAARRRFLTESTDENLTACQNLAKAWGWSQNALRNAEDTERRSAAAEALG